MEGCGGVWGFCVLTRFDFLAWGSVDADEWFGRYDNRGVENDYATVCIVVGRWWIA